MTKGKGVRMGLIQVTKTETKITLLAIVKGTSFLRIPYIVHKKLVAATIKKVGKEMSLVSFDISTFTT